MPVGRSSGGVWGNGARSEDGGTSPRRQEPHAAGRNGTGGRRNAPASAGTALVRTGLSAGLIRISAGEGTARSRSPSLAEWARASRSYSRDERGRLSHVPSPSPCPVLPGRRPRHSASGRRRPPSARGSPSRTGRWSPPALEPLVGVARGVRLHRGSANGHRRRIDRATSAAQRQHPHEQRAMSNEFKAARWRRTNPV